MGSPENSPPDRPRTVPEDARWDPKDPGFEWIAGGLDADGRRHGKYRSWTRQFYPELAAAYARIERAVGPPL